MALIKCPECGRDVSDKSSKCPQCGFPIRESMGANDEKQEALPTEEISVQQPDEPNKKKKSLIAIGVLAVIFVGIVIAGTLILSKKNGSVTVSDVDISKWKLTDRGEYFDDYEGTVVSETKRPFVAVIGSYENDTSPELVYVEDGKGVIQVSESSDDDPSIKYKPIGYISGKKITEKIFKDISVKDSYYHDYSWEETSCRLDVNFQMNTKKNGIIFFDMTDDTANKQMLNCYTVVSNGVSIYTINYEELPYKTRGVDVKITPKYFCECDTITDKDYEVEEAFDMEKEKFSDSFGYYGTEELSMKEENGAVLYTTELKSGGEKEDRGNIEYKSSFLDRGSCDIHVFYVTSDDKVLEPEYEINIFGYLSWKDFVKEC